LNREKYEVLLSNELKLRSHGQYFIFDFKLLIDHFKKVYQYINTKVKENPNYLAEQDSDPIIKKTRKDGIQRYGN
jgi:hypothetical protein